MKYFTGKILNNYIFTLKRYMSAEIKSISTKCISMYLFCPSIESFFVVFVAVTLSDFSPSLSCTLSVFFSSLSGKLGDNIYVKLIILSVLLMLTIDI